MSDTPTSSVRDSTSNHRRHRGRERPQRRVRVSGPSRGKERSKLPSEEER